MLSMSVVCDVTGNSRIDHGAGPKDIVIDIAEDNQPIGLAIGYVFITFQDMIAVAKFEAALAEVKKELLK